MNEQQKACADRLFHKIRDLKLIIIDGEVNPDRQDDLLFCKVHISSGDVIWLDVYLNAEDGMQIWYQLQKILALFDPLMDLTAMTEPNPQIRFFGHFEGEPVRVVLHQMKKEVDDPVREG